VEEGGVRRELPIGPRFDKIAEAAFESRIAVLDKMNGGVDVFVIVISVFSEQAFSYLKSH